jgi:hypothetical protein
MEQTNVIMLLGREVTGVAGAWSVNVWPLQADVAAMMDGRAAGTLRAGDVPLHQFLAPDPQTCADFINFSAAERVRELMALANDGPAKTPAPPPASLEVQGLQRMVTELLAQLEQANDRFVVQERRNEQARLWLAQATTLLVRAYQEARLSEDTQGDIWTWMGQDTADKTALMPGA